MKLQCTLFLLILASTAFSPLAVQAQSNKPTQAELNEAVETFRKMGGTYLPKAAGFAADETIPVFFMKWDSGNEDIKKLPNLKFPFMLHCNNSFLTDASIKELKAFPNLVALDVSGTRVTDKGLRDLKDLKALRLIGLSSRQQDDACIEVLCEEGFLHLIGWAMAKDGKRATNAKEIVTIEFLGSYMTNKGFKRLSTEMPNLERLVVGSSSLTGECVSDLKNFPKLKDLSLSVGLATDKTLKELHALPALESLNISGEKVTDAGLRELKSIKTLKSLEAVFTKGTKSGFKELQDALPGLKLKLIPELK